MFVKLNHQQLDVYQISRPFVFECHLLTQDLPVEEKFGMVTQIRRTALTVHLNRAEVASRKSPAERKRFYKVVRASIIEIDAALNIGNDLNHVKEDKARNLVVLMTNCFKTLTGMINPK